MKVAVLSDIHANQTALCACMEELKKRKKRGCPVDVVILLGDYVTDCPYPQRTMELLYELSLLYPCHWIRGNREEYLLTYQNQMEENDIEEKWEESSSTGSLLYTYNNLSKKDLDFFRSLPISDVITLEGCKPLCVFHGSPKDAKELLKQGNGRAEYYLKERAESYLLGGHTHDQCEIRCDGKVFWNPGALGIPFGVKGKTIFSILTSKTDGWDCEWVTIPYSIEAEIKQFEESGLNRMANIYALVTRQSLIEGRNIMLETVTLANKLAEQEGIEKKGLKIPEKYWEDAARRLKIL